MIFAIDILGAVEDRGVRRPVESAFETNTVVKLDVVNMSTSMAKTKTSASFLSDTGNDTARKWHSQSVSAGDVFHRAAKSAADFVWYVLKW